MRRPGDERKCAVFCSDEYRVRGKVEK